MKMLKSIARHWRWCRSFVIVSKWLLFIAATLSKTLCLKRDINFKGCRHLYFWWLPSFIMWTGLFCHMCRSTWRAYVDPPAWLLPQCWMSEVCVFLIKRKKRQRKVNEAEGCLTTFPTLLHLTVVNSWGFHTGLFWSGHKELWPCCCCGAPPPCRLVNYTPLNTDLHSRPPAKLRLDF